VLDQNESGREDLRLDRGENDMIQSRRLWGGDARMLRSRALCMRFDRLLLRPSLLLRATVLALVFVATLSSEHTRTELLHHCVDVLCFHAIDDVVTAAGHEMAIFKNRDILLLKVQRVATNRLST